ncbi:DUF4232 domain-containing protein [Nocardia sp. NPDC004604]|uniref:DUF4232 domain-containing protein n=1 Tax=Nocardia sp. NPDC004604 TaxID=3157013 RepID=UPI0033A785F9
MRLIAAAALVAALPMAACESSSPAPSASMITRPAVAVTPHTPIPEPSVPAASVPGATTPATTGPPTDAPPLGAPHCATTDVALSLENAGGAAGSIYAPIDFTNITARTCALFGYPAVSLAVGDPPLSIGPTGEQITDGEPQQVILGPGAVAHATVRYTQAGNYDCEHAPAEYLLIYPPNQTVAVTLPFGVDACVQPAIALLHVDYVKPGTAN